MSRHCEVEWADLMKESLEWGVSERRSTRSSKIVAVYELIWTDSSKLEPLANENSRVESILPVRDSLS